MENLYQYKHFKSRIEESNIFSAKMLIFV